MTSIRAIGKCIDKTGFNDRYEAHEIVEQAFDKGPREVLIATVSCSLSIGSHGCGQAGLWPKADFAKRFVPCPK